MGSIDSRMAADPTTDMVNHIGCLGSLLADKPARAGAEVVTGVGGSTGW